MKVISLTKKRANNLHSGLGMEKGNADWKVLFEDAAKVLTDSKDVKLSDKQKLKAYGLFKQASIGDINTERPGMLDFKGKAKWDAWHGVKNMTKE